MQIVIFLADTVFFVLVFVALLRAWLNAQRISLSGQPGTFIMAATDWLVMPLRRTMPLAWQRSRWDMASVLAAGVLVLLHSGVLLAMGYWAMGGAGVLGGPAAWLAWPLLAFKLLLRTVLQGLLMLVLGYAVLSWVQPHAPAYAWLHRLLLPLLAPLRRVIPLVGGVDLCALALVVLLQVGLMLLG